ncbi:MAG: fused response regulator/phosphatase [Planctomycetes bacterium]|nr:fused response regulator/phosphatase [Planctomycetota bacterium]
MRVLIGWDNPSEAETMSLCLNVDATEAVVTTCAEEFVGAAVGQEWDVLILSLDFPNEEESFSLFEKIHRLQPNAPVIGACHQGQIIQLPRFLNRGLHSHITRDPNGEFIFLLPTVIEAAFEAAQAERNRELNLRLQEEIESVRKLQESVIPKDIAVPPGYKIAARYEPSQIRVLGGQPVVLAGGDYYDVFAIDDQKLILILGDASGHGMKACMSIMTIHTLIRMIREERYANTGDYVTQVNQHLCGNEIVADEGGFITLLYCSLDSATHTLHWTSAGHPMPLLHNLETNEVTTLASDEAAGPPLGITDELPYYVCSAAIPTNSRVLFYTDGLAEAMPESEDESDEFGEEGIIQNLKASADLPIQKALDMLFEASHAHTGGAGRHDDTSVVLLERKR